MNMIKKGVLLFITVLLVSLSVSAADFEVEFEAVDNTITLGELAKFTLTIRNNMDVKETFKVKTLDYPVWEIKTDPILNPIQFSIEPGKKREIELLVNPLHITTFGVYDINVITESINKKEKITTPLRVNLVSPQAGIYVETVLATIIIDEKIDPVKDIPIKITIDNQNIIEYPELLVKIESNLIKEEITESLGKREKKTISIIKKINPQTTPQEDTLVVELISNNKTLDTQVKRIEIISSKEITKESKVKKRFLKTVEDITLNNIGNVQYTEGIKIESSLVQTLFTSSRPKGKFIKEDGQRYLIIPVDISPGGTTTIQITKNYVTLLIIIALAAIIMGLYYLFRSPVTARKTAANIALKEGGVSELKIVLNVSNRSNNKLRNIEVIDRIPNIADLEKGLTIGTLHPTKILKHERKGTLIKWVIDNLDAGDERVISYKIKSHLSILGEFSLTPTIVKFNFKGKEIITHSNSLGISP
jgi:hypothetical protein